ncbi:MAG TPA: GAF domain-containing SpoIIE family protein phosphatase [Tepidisphaeraceae bacterium]|nr:GAF domain-containing SpoIIE family protein phosphatase [Tepidisphaeraceae bacterium]
MIVAAEPVDEAERLAELQALEVLDTPAEDRFNRIVELAARVFHVPIAYVSLIDADRQWFKARCGIEAVQTSRDVSFCAHTILQDEPLIVNDTLLDPRFCDSPLVVDEPHIRFYAGHPLAGPGGHNVGTLCLADRVPRTLDKTELEILARLAAMAEHELGMVSLIRTQRELLETKTHLLEAQQRLQNELAEAAAYVQSLLPPPLEKPVRIDWQYVSSSELGGDFFGYRWLDENRLAVYLLDVMGHGVGAALFSTSVESALRGNAPVGLAFDDPAAVVTALNAAFPMEENGGRFFSMFYGIYHRRDHSLLYANAGHPPPLLFNDGQVSNLGSTGMVVGVMPNTKYRADRIAIPPGSRLYLYSDGAFEVELPDGEMLFTEGLQDIISRVSKHDGPQTAEILRLIREAQGKTEFKDDVSILELAFD